MRREVITHVGAFTVGAIAFAVLQDSGKADIQRNSTGGVTKIDRGNYSLILGGEDKPSSLVLEIPNAHSTTDKQLSEINTSVGEELLAMGCRVIGEAPLDSQTVTVGGETARNDRREIVIVDLACFDNAK